jgi:dTMP kinase
VFVSLEGLDGCGKTTQAALLTDALRAAGTEVVQVREPGGTPVGERIRDLLLDPDLGFDPWAEALLYAAARAQLVDAVIRPALTRGATVVADRYVDSSLAYQGHARGLGIGRVFELNMLATGGLLPDRTVLLSLPRADATARRSRVADRIEAERDAVQAAVAEGFAHVVGRFPDRVRVVDARGRPAEVAGRVLEAIGVDARRP